MSLLKKMLKKSTTPSKGICDNCAVIIQEDDPTLCFHNNETEIFLCETCIEEIFKQFKQEL
jgi:hypothetical protein